MPEGRIVLLPAKPGTCPECATAHEKEMPHNLCLYYQYHFFGEHGRFPKWKDAMAHCTDDIKERTIRALKELGYEVE